MKKLFIMICGTALVFSGCMEKGPFINFSDAVVADTTYTISPVPTADLHNVLAEEFTGQSCPNCPGAHDLLRSLPNADTRLNILSLYIFGVIQALPPSDSKHNFQDSVATAISANVYTGAPLSGIPCGGIDRVPVSGVLSLYSSSWPDAYNQRLNITDSVNLSVVSTYNDADTTATITATTTYLQQVSTPQNLSIAIVEDSIIDKQEQGTSVNNNYLFLDVFRDLVTSGSAGDPIASKLAIKTPGTRNVRTYTYKVKKSLWNPKNCRVIAFVSESDPANKEVLQSVQVKLAP